MYQIQDISDFVINACKVEGNSSHNVLKHQKLLYYIQAWYLAFYDTPAFEGNFEAWVHGPVHRTIYDLYKNSHYIYSELEISDIKNPLFAEGLDQSIINHINNVLEVYAPLSGSELEELSHRELPWLQARGNISPYQRCEAKISEKTMAEYYRQRLNP